MKESVDYTQLKIEIYQNKLNDIIKQRKNLENELEQLETEEFITSLILGDLFDDLYEMDRRGNL